MLEEEVALEDTSVQRYLENAIGGERISAISVHLFLLKLPKWSFVHADVLEGGGYGTE